MNRERTLKLHLAIALAIGSAAILNAQPQITPAQASTMTPADPATLPTCGTYWPFDKNGKLVVPWPENPFPTTVPVYSLGEPGQFLIGSTSNDWATLAIQGPVTRSTSARTTQSTRATLSPAPLPAPYGDLSLADTLPSAGTFWSLQHTNWPPMPSDYCSACPVYLLPDGSFLVDDRGQGDPRPLFASRFPPANANLYSTNLWLHLDWITNNALGVTAWNTQPGQLYNILSKSPFQRPSWTIEKQIVGTSNQTWTAFQLDTQFRSSLFLWATNTGTPLATGFAPDSFWIELSNVVGTNVYLKIHGTIEDSPYEIESRTSLATGGWAAEGDIVYGTEGQDWTAVTLGMAGRSSVFFRAKFLGDSDGNGIADEWEIRYFGTNGVDPYALCPSGDGWTFYQAYLKGWDPYQFHTPPPPQNVRAQVDGTGTYVTITWTSGGGPVTNYVVEGGYWGDPFDHYASGEVSPSDPFTFTVTAPYPLSSNDYTPRTFRVKAVFANGSTSASPDVLPSAYLLGTVADAKFVRGPGGHYYLAISGLPADSIKVHLFRYDGLGNWPGVDIPASAFTNGVATLSADDIQYARTAQVFTTGGVFNLPIELDSPYAMEADGLNLSTWPDASKHMKENLKFLLRSATLTLPFGYASDVSLLHGPDGTPWDQQYTNYPESYFVRPTFSTDYEYYGFHTFSPNLDYSFIQELRPVQDNFIWRNLAFDPQIWNSEVVWGSPLGQRQVSGLTYVYTGIGTESPLPVALTNDLAPWLLFAWEPGGPSYDTGVEVGCISNTSGGLSLVLAPRNVFGLPLLSLRMSWQDEQVFLPGDELNSVGSEQFYFPNFQGPMLRTVDYFFTSQTPFFNYNYPYNTPRPPMPGSPDFGVTTPSPLLITGVGQQITVSGWAKQEITNGYSGKYGYLEQYFDKARKVDSSGNVTTNETGVLSEYGEFFPTEPGPVALVTKADIETGQRGTGVVNVIKLQLDVNHDGVMDLSYGGPDNTSRYRRFAFWINNDRDLPGTDTTLDHDAETDPNDPRTQDWYYGRILSQRNLEDFARLWICGLPPLPVDQGYTATLSLVPSSGNPAINLYFQQDPTGSAAYLTNRDAAEAQLSKLTSGDQTIFDWAKKLTALSSNQSYTLPVNIMTGEVLYPHLLFEGVAKGSGQLVLTVAQGTNVFAQTSAWIDLRDVKDLYEQATVTNVQTNWPAMVEEDRVSGFKVVSTPADVLDSTKQLVVFVHGWRIPQWEYYTFSETMFKRLYWQGYQGRFAALRWPTRSKDTDPLLHVATYNRSEHIAFESGAGTAAYLRDIRSRFPDYTIGACAHSMGNVVMMEALKELQDTGQAPIDNYVLMQAAVPSHCYDPTVTNLPALVAAEQNVPTPDLYRSYGVGITNALRVGGNLVNFLNPIDFALVSGIYETTLGSWEFNEGFYTTGDNGPITMKPNTILGYYTDGTNSLLRTNEFNTLFSAGLYGGYYGPSHPPTRAVTNTFEIMPFISRPRSKAAGAQPGVQGQIRGGELNLQSQLGFSAATYDHSGEFNRQIQDGTVNGFYSQLRSRLFP